jgi:PmbA protein
LALLDTLLRAARAAGADQADAMLVERISLSIERRLGRTETLERSESRDMGLRVFCGKRAAVISVSESDPKNFATLAERAVAMARIVPEDPFGGLADFVAAAEEASALDLDDLLEPSAERLIARADEAEQAAMAIKGVTNSEGGSAGFTRSRISLAASNGFAGSLSRSNHAISASVLAGAGTSMQRDYDYHSTVHFADLDAPAAIGKKAGEQAVARLNPERPKTGRLPVVYAPRVASSLLGHLSAAINGAAIVRGTSFLKDSMGQQIFAPGIDVHDDPRRVRGLRSGTFDGEGVPTRTMALIEDGFLTSWILDARSARALNLAPLGHASRGAGSAPSPSTSNLYLGAGTVTPDALIGDIALGIYVTELIGMGINQLNGDYSRGAAGFMIRQGKLAEPVAELTIAGNLREMFMQLTPANDLVFRRGTDAPTLRIAEMTIAGA